MSDGYHYENITRCCGAHCYYGSKKYPCWGDVTVADEDGEGNFIHTCYAHVHFPSGGEYVEPEDDDDRSTLRDNDEDIE